MFHTRVLPLQIKGQCVLPICENMSNSVAMDDVREASKEKVTWARKASVDPK